MWAPPPPRPGAVAAKPVAVAPAASHSWHDRGVDRPPAQTDAQPAQAGVCDGLAYTLWLPAGATTPRAGVVVLHGAGSCKENHHDFARAASAVGLAAIVFDQRGHGASIGPMDDRAIEDIATIAARLRSALGGAGAPVALRGSSMGGCLAIAAAPACEATAVVAICPARPEGLARGLATGELSFEADHAAFERLLAAIDLGATLQSLAVPVLLLHAEGDEQVPVEHSRQLATRMRSPASRLIVVPGGHHRSIQHDPQLQSQTLRFLVTAAQTRLTP